VESPLGLLLLFTLTGSMAGSQCHQTAVGQATSSLCPPEPTLELLHDAIFHLDQGDDDDRVRRDLLAVPQPTRVSDAATAWVQQLVKRVQAALHADSAVRPVTAEIIRKDFHDSICLTAEMHNQFHLRLRGLGQSSSRPTGIPK